MDALKIPTYEVYINYSWRERLSIKKIGGDDTYTEYESYYYTILEDGKPLALKDYFDKLRATPQDHLEMEKIDYFLQFVPAAFNTTSSNSGITSNPPVEEKRKSNYLTHRLNEKYSSENRKLFESLKLTYTKFSNLNKDELSSINEFLKENYQSDIYNRTSLLDDPNKSIYNNSNNILFISYKGEIISMCCVATQKESIVSEISQKAEVRLNTIGVERRYVIQESQLTLCVTKKEFRNKGIMKAAIKIILRQTMRSEYIWAITDNFGMKNTLRFLGFREHGKPFLSNRSCDYQFFRLYYGNINHYSMMNGIY